MSVKHYALWGYLFNANIIRKYRLRFIEGLAYSEDRLFIYQMARYCKTIAFFVTSQYMCTASTIHLYAQAKME